MPYSASKLCNILTVREFPRRTGRSDISAMAFDPALTPGTGLARDYPAPLRFAFNRIMPLVVRGGHVSTPALSGGALASLVLEPAYAAESGSYFPVRDKRMSRREPSALARDPAVAAKLWDDSLALIDEA